MSVTDKLIAEAKGAKATALKGLLLAPKTAAEAHELAQALRLCARLYSAHAYHLEHGNYDKEDGGAA